MVVGFVEKVFYRFRDSFFKKRYVKSLTLTLFFGLIFLCFAFKTYSQTPYYINFGPGSGANFDVNSTSTASWFIKVNSSFTFRGLITTGFKRNSSNSLDLVVSLIRVSDNFTLRTGNVTAALS